MTPIGKMNTSVTLQQQVQSTGKGGGQDVSYSDIATVWAAISTRAQSVSRVAGAPEYPVTIRFKTHYAKAFEKTRRIKMPGLTASGRNFDVVSITDPDLRGRSLVFEANELVR